MVAELAGYLNDVFDLNDQPTVRIYFSNKDFMIKIFKFSMIFFGILISVSAKAQTNAQTDMRKIGPLRVIMCMYAGGKYQMVSNPDLSGLSKAVFQGYTTLASVIPSNEGSVVSQEASQRLQSSSTEDHLIFIAECAKNPVARPYILEANRNGR